MEWQVDRSGILDLCTAFEEMFRRWVTTAIGEARRVVDRHYNVRTLRGLKRRLLRDQESFDSLASIVQSIDGLISSELAASPRRLRDERNRVAHRPLPNEPSDFSVDDVRDLLNEVIEAIGNE